MLATATAQLHSGSLRPKAMLNFVQSGDDPELWAVVAYPVTWGGAADGAIDPERRTIVQSYVDDSDSPSFRSGAWLDDKSLIQMWMRLPCSARDAVLTTLRRAFNHEWESCSHAAAA